MLKYFFKGEYRLKARFIPAVVTAMGKSKMMVVVLAVLAVFSGCVSVRYVARETDPREVESFEELCGWSLDLEGGKREIRVAKRETIGAFKVRTNYWYALITVLSAGHWMPVDVIYEVNQ
mgnify:CR=1 FL=1